jgi:hypothetical protein
VKKNRLNQLNFKKTDRFGLGFISLKSKNQIEPKPKKPEKTESNRKKTEPKPSQTGLNRYLF